MRLKLRTIVIFAFCISNLAGQCRYWFYASVSNPLFFSSEISSYWCSYSFQELSWISAFHDCQMKNMTMATIHSGKDFNRLAKVLNKNHANVTWIGGSGEFNNTIWWPYGDPVDKKYIHAATPKTTNQNTKKQPKKNTKKNTKNPFQACVSAEPDLKYEWTHRNCNSQHSYVCEEAVHNDQNI